MGGGLLGGGGLWVAQPTKETRCQVHLEIIEGMRKHRKVRLEGEETQETARWEEVGGVGVFCGILLVVWLELIMVVYFP